MRFLLFQVLASFSLSKPFPPTSITQPLPRSVFSYPGVHSCGLLPQQTGRCYSISWLGVEEQEGTGGPLGAQKVWDTRSRI